MIICRGTNELVQHYMTGGVHIGARSQRGAVRCVALEFFGPQMALAYRLDAISQGPKNSQFPGPNPLPLALVNGYARIKNIMHGAVKIISALPQIVKILSGY